ncbi:MarR family winged helix-turn-helix transcriptional regulator [Paraburkholderia acidisoli]|uniref:MarR family transcriptional regulator n=1 Tax=Paraburkholderia acidisoli TaxID=2571748 RepID=A0A7Z2GLZ3_9BURK|nr:MarR family winged helix-turn-helix transcriptional regulator [Paraburkholderia acidisoli]QGZ64262.1 MarR family transcriptional regulator [Paraburkholderia acidisoli]
MTFAQQHAERFGLSIPEWRVVAVLGRYGELSSGEVMERTSMDKAKVSRAVTRMSAMKLISRSDNVNDMRSNRLKLTRKGQQIHDQITPIATNLERELLDVLTESEREVFVNALTKLDKKVIEMSAGDLGGNAHV